MTEIEMWERLTEITKSDCRSREFCWLASIIFSQRWDETAYPGLHALALMLNRASRYVPDDFLMDAVLDEKERAEGVAE